MKYILIVLIIFISDFISGQSINNINAIVIGDKIQIDFKIHGLKKHQEINKIELFVKKKGVNYFEGPMTYVQQSTNYTNGNNTIYWNALNEMALDNEELILDIRALIKENERKRRIILMYVGNGITPVGIRFGQIGKVSWFIEGRASLEVNKNARYTYFKGAITDYDQIRYELRGDKVWKAYTAIAAITIEFYKNWHYYVGAGYGMEYRLFHLEHFSENGSLPTGDGWAKDQDHLIEGLALDSGIIFNYKALVIGIGGSSLDFRSYQWKGSLGIRF